MRSLSRLLALALLAALITACTAQSPRQLTEPNDALGTQWGEGIESRSTSVALSRESTEPLAVQIIQYSGRQPEGRKVKELQLDRGRIGLAILDEQEKKLDLAQNSDHSQLQGRVGERYQIWLSNYGPTTYEIVSTVDGIDVLNGSPGSFRNRGYVLYPGKTLLIEGFRKSRSEVAAFRFAKPGDAYAANTPAGDLRNLGTIGVAVFTLQAPSTGTSRAFPAEQGFAPPPSYSH
ncbi:hypothetical protein HNP46_006992 [Pseudomonas nitritireducens]|uniref:Outer membrane lipoprotein n=1 Tax=Pseudomonas nitroreducens TaxID=46680 RepID=A0A7W7P4H5_PSENT|nr:hypothetical protein [Pseudomonas nitritireducens]MBB4868073.1 hypothetical protein [Pseudomonas nitritireducens]